VEFTFLNNVLFPRFELRNEKGRQLFVMWRCSVWWVALGAALKTVITAQCTKFLAPCGSSVATGMHVMMLGTARGLNPYPRSQQGGNPVTYRRIERPQMRCASLHFL